MNVFFCLIKREWMEGLELDFRVDALIDVTIEKKILERKYLKIVIMKLKEIFRFESLKSNQNDWLVTFVYQFFYILFRKKLIKNRKKIIFHKAA